MNILDALASQPKPKETQPIDDCVKDGVWECTYWSRFYDVPREERAEFLARVEGFNVGYFDD